MNKDLVSGIGLLGIAVAYYWASRSIAVSSLEDDFGPHGLPNILAVALGCVGLLLIVRAVWARRKTSPVVVAVATEQQSSPLKALGLLIIGYAYILLVDKLGYPVTTALLIGGVAWYEGLRPSWRLAAVAALGSALFWLLFVRLLDVAQPAGLLF